MFELMKARVNVRGGKIQQDRMIKDKRRSLDSSIKASYQAAKVRDINKEEVVKALINPNKNKVDYDDKIISVGFESGFTTGTIFEWQNTNTKWLIYLQDLTELAYFRGDIRKCNYYINWLDDKGNKHTSYAAIRGPVETKITSSVTSKLTYDIPNSSLHILMPKSEETVKQFKRYTRFYLDGLESYEDKTCWRIEATDTISTPGILELTAVEYYQNDIKDNIEENLADVYPLQEKIEKEQEQNLIQGQVFIKPNFEYVYKYVGGENASWWYDVNLPIKTTINDKIITIKWLKSYSGQFDLKYGLTTKTIVVESLF